MLILRVASGRAWDEETYKGRLSTLKFNTSTVPDVSESRLRCEDGGGEVHLKTFLDKQDMV